MHPAWRDSEGIFRLFIQCRHCQIGIQTEVALPIRNVRRNERALDREKVRILPEFAARSQLQHRAVCLVHADFARLMGKTINLPTVAPVMKMTTCRAHRRRQAASGKYSMRRNQSPMEKRLLRSRLATGKWGLSRLRT